MLNPLGNPTWIVAFVAVTFSLSPAHSQAKKEQPKVQARLIVEDRGEFFSPESIKKAKALLSEIKSQSHLEMNIITFKELPDSKKKQFEKLETAAERSDFYRKWAKEESVGARGLLVVIWRNPGHVLVLADKQIRDKGFTARDEEQIVKILVDKFKEAKDKPADERQAICDKALLNATEFIRDIYKKIAPRQRITDA